MTLLETITKILEIAKRQKNVGYVGEGDIYSLNNLPNIDYSVIFVTQSNHSQTTDLMQYHLTVYYVDRLMNDDSNRLQIQSHGISVLKNLFNVISEELDIVISDVNYTTFTHRFKDNCSGVFANITITTDNEIGLCSYE